MQNIRQVCATIRTLCDRQQHRLGELREARKSLCDAMANGDFCRDYHSSKFPAFDWRGVWEKELLPLERYCFHLKLSDNTLFALEAQGAADDAVMLVQGKRTFFQFTLAFERNDPSLPRKAGEGYYNKVQAEYLLEHGTGMGGDTYRRQGGKVIRVGRRGASRADEIETNQSDAIGRAIARKSSAANNNCQLIVFCTDFTMLGADIFNRIASERCSSIATSFCSVAVVSHYEGYAYWHRPLSQDPDA